MFTRPGISNTFQRSIGPTKLCESQGPTPPIGEGGISAGCDQQKQGTLLAFMDSDGGKSTTLNNVSKTW